MNPSGRLSRSSTDRIIAGVCGGIAKQFNVDPTLVRVAFVLLTLFAGISPWIYLLLWVAIPSDNSTATNFGQQLQQNLGEIQQKATAVVEQVSDKVQQIGGQQSQPTPPTQTPSTPSSTPVSSQHHDDTPTTGPTTRL
ncbi:MAG: PspC domain-containing protein [Herpetosiphonaceae bacterium]|nr:PspC domain-containing protein [Herpetosiphonaceae bacterium]